MNKKILIGVIIAVVILTIPVSTAIDIETVVDTKSSENFETGTLDNNVEVISFIEGTCNRLERNPKSLFLSAKILAGGWGTSFLIRGYKRPLFNPEENYFSVYAIYAYVPIFIGFRIPYNYFYDLVWGIALGDIEYTES